MSTPISIDIAAIDRQLSEQGRFCLIDWMLAQNHLAYSDYEDWRYGRLKYLEDPLSQPADALGKLLENTTTHCEALGLGSEELSWIRWDDPRQSTLSASQDSHRHRLLSQVWTRTGDSPQLDLFMDNSALITENELRDSLSARDFDRADTLLQKLIELNPAHQQLGGYQDLINYGRHITTNQRITPDAIAAEMQGLVNEVQALAGEALGPGARDYLALAWRRLANNLEDQAFDPRNPELHRSYALMQIPDWRGVQQNLADINGIENHPRLLQRQAAAFDALREPDKALLVWCILMDLHPDHAEQAIEQTRGQAIYRQWEAFCNSEQEWPNGYFPAYLLARHPVLIEQLQQFAPLKTPPTLAMIEMMQNRLNGQDEIKARERLQRIDPRLLAMYMEIRQSGCGVNLRRYG